MDLAAAVPGVDLSHWDDARGARPVDYDRMAGAVRWAILRVGDGGARDRSFDRHADGLDGRVPLGTYLFCRPGRDPVVQAEAWAGAVQRAEARGVQFELGHWADLEASDGLGRVEVARWIGSFLGAADAALGRPVSIYTSASWWAVNVDADLAINGERLWWVARYPFGTDVPALPSSWPLWVAEHATPARMPRAPFGAPVAVWQWSSQGHGASVGTFREAALDCNLMDAVVFAALTALDDASVPPAPAPVPSPPSQEDDMARIVRRKADPGGEQDPRLYKTNLVWKERIQDGEWDQACDDLGLPRGTFEDLDAGRVNRMATIGIDPT